MGGVFGYFGALMGAPKVGAVVYDFKSGGWEKGEYKDCLNVSLDKRLGDYTDARNRLNKEWFFGCFFFGCFWAHMGAPRVGVCDMTSGVVGGVGGSRTIACEE